MADWPWRRMNGLLGLAARRSTRWRRQAIRELISWKLEKEDALRNANMREKPESAIAITLIWTENNRKKALLNGVDGFNVSTMQL